MYFSSSKCASLQASAMGCIFRARSSGVGFCCASLAITDCVRLTTSCVNRERLVDSGPVVVVAAAAVVVAVVVVVGALAPLLLAIAECWPQPQPSTLGGLKKS